MLTLNSLKLNFSRVEKKSLKSQTRTHAHTHTRRVLSPHNSRFQQNSSKSNGCGKSGGQNQVVNTCTHTHKRQMPLMPFRLFTPLILEQPPFFCLAAELLPPSEVSFWCRNVSFYWPSKRLNEVIKESDRKMFEPSLD